MDIDRILCELEENRGYFPREAVEEAIRQRETITPYLLRAIREATERGLPPHCLSNSCIQAGMSR